MLVIGAGAAGLMCAYKASLDGARVTVLERNEKAGKKIYITGKGRCNVTNACSVEKFFDNVCSNPKFLYGAIHTFSSKDLMALLNSLGLKLKVERGERVFPESDKASDVTNCLYKACLNNGVIFQFNTTVLNTKHNGKNFEVSTDKGLFVDDTLVIAVGGKSYSVTGSKGDGYAFAKSFGHSIIEPVAALSALLADNTKPLAGLSLKNVTATVYENGKKIYSEFGEMLFTHQGISGPIILTLSSLINRKDFDRLSFEIDLKPALDDKKLSDRLLRDFAENKNKQICNVLGLLMPKALIEYVLRESKISGDKQVNSITKEERNRLVGAVKHLTFKIQGLYPIDEAIVTAGGVSVKEINPKTMESRLCKGLYFAGEVLDVDCFTGGFNLQTAFSTGFIAGMYGAKNIQKE